MGEHERPSIEPVTDEPAGSWEHQPGPVADEGHGDGDGDGWEPL